MTVRHDPKYLYRASSQVNVTKLRLMAYGLQMEARSRHDSPKKADKDKVLSPEQQLMLDGFVLAIDVIIEQGRSGITGAELRVQLKKRMPQLGWLQADLVMSNVYRLVPRTLHKAV